MKHALLIFLLVLISCGPEVVDLPGPDADISLIVLDGAELDGARDLALRERIRIDGDDSLLKLSFVPDLAASTGLVLAVDGQLSMVFVFDSVGRVVERFGGNGDGPGELRRPSRIAMAGDTVYILDEHGLNLFSVRGSFLNRAPISSGNAGATAHLRPFPQSLDYGGGRLVTSFVALGQSAPIGDAVSLHTIDSGGVVGRPFMRVVSEHIYELGQGVEGPPLFAARSRFTVALDGTVYVTLQDGVHIVAYTPNGVASHALKFDAPRRTPTAAERDSLIHAFERSVSAAGLADPSRTAQLRQGLQKHPRARYRSIVGTILAGDDVLLVKRQDLSPLDPQTDQLASWDLIRSDGSMLGRLRLPANFEPKVISEEYLTGVQLDSLNVPSIVQYGFSRG